MRIGFGWDLHKLKKGRPLIIGGVTIPSPFGELAHSDGDVLIHAVIDALFGALSLGDIGSHYPPSDEKYKNISSRILLKDAVSKIHAEKFKIVNIDTTIILQKPKLSHFIEEIKNTLSKDLEIDPGFISVKAKTKEGVDAAGRSKAVEAYASVLLNEC